MTPGPQPYLAPYLRAAERFGEGFGSLLWASPQTQRARFNAIRKSCDPTGKSVLDVGCGRADYLAYLIERDARPADYIGIEMVEPLAAAAERQADEVRHALPTTILRADFVRDPARMFVGADIVMFSGSLNTLDTAAFYSTLGRAFDAAAEALVFNFLCSSCLAGRNYLIWHKTEDVLKFVEQLSPSIKIRSEYLIGDCTICVLKPDATPRAIHPLK